MEQFFLLITGMHRSGTSFLARALNLMGVYLGDFKSLISNDWVYKVDNIRGHWEDKKLIELADKTLAKNNSSWDNISQKIICNDDTGMEIMKRIKELSNYASLLAGFKDPRLLVVFDSWKRYLPKNIIIVGIFRNPLEVAESLKKRNGLSYEKSLNLWQYFRKIKS